MLSAEELAARFPEPKCVRESLKYADCDSLVLIKCNTELDMKAYLIYTLFHTARFSRERSLALYFARS